jgi:hypothetical protein
MGEYLEMLMVEEKGKSKGKGLVAEKEKLKDLKSVGMKVSKKVLLKDRKKV